MFKPRPYYTRESLIKFKKYKWYFNQLIPFVNTLEYNYNKYLEEKDERRRQNLIHSMV